jgi:hypothetical protein
MKKATLMGGLGLVSVLIALRLAVLQPAIIAARNLAAINSLSAGKSTEVELLQRKPFRKASRTCFQESCIYHLEARNALLSSLHLAPLTFIATLVTVRDGLVTDVTVFSHGEGVRTVVIRQMQHLPDDCVSDPCVRLPRANSLAATRILLDNRSDLRNHLPEAVNTGCLSYWRGCRRSSDFMPVVRQLENGKFQIEKP